MKEKEEIKASKTGKKEIMPAPKTEDGTREKDSSRKTGDFRSRFLENLMIKREEVEKALNHLIDREKEYKSLLSADDFIEEADHAEREISAQKHYSLLERKNKELEKIEILIRRVLEDEEFCLCEECGKRIPEERLLIVPEATRCVPCQREMEKLDSRKSLVERSYPCVAGKKELQWEDTEDLDDKELGIETDIDDMSIVDLEETDVEDSPGENSETKG